MKFNTAINNDDNTANETTIKNSDDIQKDVFKIMGFETDNTEKETDNTEKESNAFSFDFQNNNDTDNKKSIADLKTDSKTAIQESNDLTISKFEKIESLLVKMNSIDSTFIDFLNNQKETLQVLNNFSKLKDDIETYFHNIIKNQSEMNKKHDSILNAINSLNGNFTKSLTITEKDKKPDTDKKPNTVILRKGNNSNDDILKSYFLEFKKNFNGNFLYEKELNDDTFQVWKALMHHINDENADTIESSIRDYWSKFTKSNDGKVVCAKKSNKKFISGMITTIETMQGKTKSFDNSVLPNNTLDKNHFIKNLNLTEKDIETIISELKKYGKVDSSFIKQVSAFLESKKPDISDNSIGQFMRYIKGYIG